MFVVCCLVFFFLFKQKTAYEMRISVWSSDVCSSDLQGRQLIADSDDLELSVRRAAQGKAGSLVISFVNTASYEVLPRSIAAYRERYADIDQIGRASCRERVCQYV